jgi:hypothetical protein
MCATFKDDGYFGLKEITHDGFGELIAAIEAGQVDVVIVRDIDRLTRNLTDWNSFEKARVRHGGGGDADVSRKIAASTATAAGSSIRSGNPCRTRERRASSAPTCRTAARSSALITAGGRWSSLAGVVVWPHPLP